MKSLFQLVWLSLLLSVLINGCKSDNNNKGFKLQEFKIVNSQLNSIIGKLNDLLYLKDTLHYHSKDILILILRMQDSIPGFWFTSVKKEDVSSHYIFLENRRIIGYNTFSGKEIIILSEINSKFDFEMMFYKFLIPTGENKYFDYIYFPERQYLVDKAGKMYPPFLFDPWFIRYEFKAGNISLIPTSTF